MIVYDTRPPVTARKGRAAWDAVEEYCGSLSNRPKISELWHARRGLWYFEATSEESRDVGSPYFKLEGDFQGGHVNAEWTSARGSWG